MIFDNIKPFGLINHTYKFTFKLVPSFKVDIEMYNLTKNNKTNEIVYENGNMEIEIPL